MENLANTTRAAAFLVIVLAASLFFDPVPAVAGGPACGGENEVICGGPSQQCEEIAAEIACNTECGEEWDEVSCEVGEEGACGEGQDTIICKPEAN